MRYRTLAVALLGLSIACGSDGDGNGVTDPDDIELPQGSVSARIDGTQWRASAGLTATYGNGIMAFGATDGTVTIGLAAGIISGPATFTIGPGQISNANVYHTSGSGWLASSGTGSGTVTITEISATHAKGTFSFTATPLPGTSAAGNRVVTNGVFDLKF